jgi:hypothetical protein
MEEISSLERFDANHILKFVVAPKGEESFYFDMQFKNKEMKFMYFVSNDDPEVDPIISIFVEDPNKSLMHTRLKKSMGLFTVKTRMKGEHKVIFSNLRNTDQK